MQDYSKAGRIKLSIIAYSLTFITGIAVSLPFVVKGSVAQDFKNNLAYVGSVFHCSCLVCYLHSYQMDS